MASSDAGTSGIFRYVMATATINNAAWNGTVALPGKTQLKVRSHSLARPGGVFLASEMVLMAGALLQSAWGGHGLGTLIGIAPCALFFHTTNLDRSIVSSTAAQFWTDVLEAIALGSVSSAGIFRVFPELFPGLPLVLAWGLLIGLLPLIMRSCLQHLVCRGKLIEEILIVGTGDLPAKLHRSLGQGLRRSKSGGPEQNFSESLASACVAMDLTELNGWVMRFHVSRVVIADLNVQSRERMAAALLDSRLRGLQVTDAVEFCEKLSGKIWVEGLNPQWFVYTNGFTLSRAGAFFKRCFDVTFASAMLLVSAPLLALTAIAIKFDSRGPVLFRQVRVGLHGKTFVIYKFRSMRDDAELAGGPVWATAFDQRVTGVGRLLRRFRLDEIPQAFNVLKGDMSIVGPRPERPCFVEQLEREIPFYGLRHYLKPGITGWAQVMFRLRGVG